MIVDNHFTRQYNPEDGSEQNRLYLEEEIILNMPAHCERSFHAIQTSRAQCGTIDISWLGALEMRFLM
jgi:hypothetical protein